MLALKVDCCHQAQDRVDHQDEEVCHRFERAVEAQRDTGSRDSYIPQVLRHVLITNKKSSRRVRTAVCQSCGRHLHVAEERLPHRLLPQKGQSDS